MMRNTVKVKSVFFAAIVALTSQVNAGSWHEVDMSDAGEFDTQCDYRAKLNGYGEGGSVLYSNEVNPSYLVFHAAGEKTPSYIASMIKGKFCSDEISDFSSTYKSLVRYSESKNNETKKCISYESKISRLIEGLKLTDIEGETEISILNCILFPNSVERTGEAGLTHEDNHSHLGFNNE